MEKYTTIVYLVGAHSYPSFPDLKDIPNVRVNLREMEEVIPKVSIVPIEKSNIYVKCDDFSQRDIFSDLREIFRNIRPIDLLIFYYAGHGERYRGNVFLTTPKCTPNTIDKDGINIHELKNIINEANVNVKVMIIDSCYSGAVHDSKSYDYMGDNHADDTLYEELRDIKGMCLITSSAGSQKTPYPKDEPQNPTFFTNCIIEILKNGISQINKKYLTIGNLIDEINRKYVHEEKYNQFNEESFPQDSLKSKKVLNFKIIKNLAHMNNINCILIVDRSSSMNTKDGNPQKTKSRWQIMQEWVIDIANQLNKLDDDGLDIVFFNSKPTEALNVKNEARVKEIFNKYTPSGGTDLYAALEKGISICVDRMSNDRQELIIVVTDGNPDAEEEERDLIEKLIVQTSGKLKDRSQLGIAFIQIGKDEECRTFLKNLDDSIASRFNVHDIVTTKTYDEVEDLSLSQIIWAAYNQ